MNVLKKSAGWAIGIGGPFLCIIHCLAFPILISIAPSFIVGRFLTNSNEIYFLVLSTIMCLAGLCWGYRQHKKQHIFWVFMAGLTWFWVGIGHRYHLRFYLVGAACFLASNVMNHYFCKSCSRCSRKEHRRYESH
jgi:apolipoprotein N-acyltransferase